MPAALSPDAAPSPKSAAPVPPQLDALIIGAGPVGLTLACELIRYGLRIRIVDCAGTPTDKSKAFVVWARTLEQLDRMGLAETFAGAGLHVTRGRLYSGETLLATLELDNIVSPFRYGLMIPQSTTERLLTERMNELGVAVEREVTFDSMTEGGDHVSAILTHANGQTEAVSARWLLGCDGAHSATRHAIGAEFLGDTLPSDWVLADLPDHRTHGVDGPEIHLHADGVLALLPIPEGRVRAIANLGKNTGMVQDTETLPAPTVDEMQAILDARGGKGISAANPIWLTRFRINERKVDNFRRGNVFLLGDAAHIHSPAGGQGMNTGMQDAVNLAWKLALVHSGQLSVAGNEILLESYTAERGPVAAAVLKDSGMLTRIGTLDNALLRGIRNQALHLFGGLGRVRHAFAMEASELAVAYEHTQLNATHGSQKGPKPGERAPLDNRSAAPVSNGHKPVFTLFAKSGVNAEQLRACYPDLLDREVWPAFTEGGIWIVRPDGYVGFAGNSDSWAAADAYLAKLKWPEAK